MLTKITGTLTRVLDERIRLQVGPIEYEALVPELVRRQVQDQVGSEITLHTCHYLEGNPMQGRMVPRLIGFLHEAELEFFELFCTVDKIGVRKALKALTCPVRLVAEAIHRGDQKFLIELPGIGPASADTIINTLRKKVTKFALIRGAAEAPTATIETAANVVAEEAYQALITVGHTPSEARDRLQKILDTGRRFSSPEEILLLIYQQG